MDILNSIKFKICKKFGHRVKYLLIEHCEITKEFNVIEFKTHEEAYTRMLDRLQNCSSISNEQLKLKELYDVDHGFNEYSAYCRCFDWIIVDFYARFTKNCVFGGNKMNVLYYDRNRISAVELDRIYKVLEKKKIDVLLMPKNVELLMNCDLNTLVDIREKINNAINAKAEM